MLLARVDLAEGQSHLFLLDHRQLDTLFRRLVLTNNLGMDTI